MTDSITLESFYQLFRESERQRQETERILRESLLRSQQEFDRSMAESKAEFDRRMAESKAETDRRADEAEQRLARAEAIAAQANQAVSALTSRWGKFVENLVAPAVIRLFQERGLAVSAIYQRVRASQGGQNLEVDILAVNTDVAVAIEVKSRLTQRNLQRVLQNLDRFKTILPQYANYQLYGAVAAIEIDGDVDTYADNQGLFVIQQAGDSVCISNDENFQPRAW